MQEYLALPPLAIASGRGGWLTDTEGRTYLDGNASIWTNVHGHNDPELNAALQRQLACVAHSTMLGRTHAPGAELAAELRVLAPAGLGRVFFSDNGSGAVEVALKLSFQYWQPSPAVRKACGASSASPEVITAILSARWRRATAGFFTTAFVRGAFPRSIFPLPRI